MCVCCCAPADGEGVIYALSEAAANAEMATRCGSDGDDLALLNEQEEPTEVCVCVRWRAVVCAVACPVWVYRQTGQSEGSSCV